MFHELILMLTFNRGKNRWTVKSSKVIIFKKQH